MTPTAKQPGQSSAAEIMLNVEISFRQRVSSKANPKISIFVISASTGHFL
jgi:hypothetical protein